MQIATPRMALLDQAVTPLATNPALRMQLVQVKQALEQTTDAVSQDLLWLRDESQDDAANLPEPHVLATGIVQDLRAALEQLETIALDLASA